MDWSNTTWWWIAVGMLVAAELVTGTFYLLMLAIGTAAGGLASYAGFSFTGQLLSAALIGGGAVVAWHLYRRRQPAAAPAAANHDMNLDIGGHVHVTAWAPDGSARVSYRGAGWDARHAGAGQPAPGDFVIVRVDGNQLVLERSPV
ncbi:MAG TPA: NfeD family protein [Ideonella sp.]|nr:NfeD family protein [Ideonella sp.]